MILAVDPAIATTGWAVIDPSKRPISVVDFGVAATEVVEGIAKTVSNARRISEVGRELGIQRDAYQCTTIAAEQMLSFGSVHAVVPQALCWGVIAHLAEQRGVELLEVVAKEWQEAVTPGLSKLKKEKRYPLVEAEVSRFVGARLLRIEKDLRTHVVDAIAIGLFAALRRSQCRTVIKSAPALHVERVERIEGAA